MRAAGWLGPLVVVAGLVLGAVLAGGMYAAEANTRAYITPVPSGPIPAAAPIAVKGVTGDAVRGRVPYDRACGGCHGADGKGDTPLHGPLLNVYYPSDTQLAGILRNGVGTMPGYQPDELSDQQMADIIAFMRALH